MLQISKRTESYSKGQILHELPDFGYKASFVFQGTDRNAIVEGLYLVLCITCVLEVSNFFILFGLFICKKKKKVFQFFIFV